MKYFEKISEKKQESYTKRNVAVGAAGVMGAGLPNQLTGPALLKSMKEIKDPKLYSAAMTKAKQQKIPVTEISSFAMKGAYNPTLKQIYIEKGQGADVLFHELGHAANYKKFKALPKLRVAGMLIGGMAPLSAAVSKKDSTVSKAAPYVAAAGMAPMLGDEVAASAKSIKNLKKAKATTSQLNIARKNLGKAFTTYGLLAAGAIAAPALIRKFKESNKK